MLYTGVTGTIMNGYKATDVGARLSVLTLSWIMVRPVQEEVMEEVCCPANSVAMSMPVISWSFR